MRHLGNIENLIHLEEAIVCTDYSGSVQWCNGAFSQMIAKTPEQVMGLSLDALMPLEQDGKIISFMEIFLEPAIKSRTPVTGKYEFKRDGDCTWLEVSLTPTATAGQERGMVFTIKNITSRRRLEELSSAKENAEKASRAKSEFLAKMSHELRTPLNSVIGFASLMLKKRESLAADQAAYLERILDNGKHLLRLINGILDLAKVEAGRMEAQMRPVDISALLRHTVMEMEGQLVNSPVTLTSEIPDRVRPLVTDEEKLKQILINLIGNAVKFTKKGSIRVRLEADEIGRIQRIQVIDTGPGIPRDKLDSIFEPFSGTQEGKRFGSTGLGLAICKSFCQVLGCHITVQSELGKGSIFTIEFTPN